MEAGSENFNYDTWIPEWYWRNIKQLKTKLRNHNALKLIMKFFLCKANVVQLLFHISGDNNNTINFWKASNHQFFFFLSQHFATA